MNGENTHNSNYSITTNEPIKDTPFRLIGNEEIGFALSVGQYRITDLQKTKEEAIDQLQTQQWKIIANLVCIILEKYKEFKGEKEEGTQASH